MVVRVSDSRAIEAPSKAIVMKRIEFLKDYRPWYQGVHYKILDSSRMSDYRGPKGVPEGLANQLVRDGICRFATVFEASHQYSRVSARKVRLLADLVRGKFADEALDILRYQPQRGARMLEKVIRSALGSAQDPDQNPGRTVNVENLIVKEARVDPGPMFKRIRPRARGMAFLIKKRTSHIHVTLDVPTAD